MTVTHARADHSRVEHRILQRVTLGTKGYFDLYPWLADFDWDAAGSLVASAEGSAAARAPDVPDPATVRGIVPHVPWLSPSGSGQTADSAGASGRLLQAAVAGNRRLRHDPGRPGGPDDRPRRFPPSSHVTTTSTFDIRLAKITPHPIPAGVPAARTLTQKANLVGSHCRTSTPISVTMSGTVDFVHGGTFSGDFSIPKFRDCRAMTAAINAIIPGDGNTFAGHVLPAGDARSAAAPGPVPVDVAPGAGTTVGTPPPPGGSGAAVQLPAKQPDPRGGLLGLLFGTG